MAFLDKYLRVGEIGWRDIADRVSGIMTYRDGREEVYEALLNKRFLPNSPALINAGAPGGRNMAACHLILVPDSISGIMDAAKWCALIFKSGGGVGIDLSNLSPSGTELRYAPRGIASGPVSFMEIFNTVGGAVMEGGLRRAAIMGTLSVNHPDIVQFIKCKNEDRELSNFNVSVTIDNGPNSVPKSIWSVIIDQAYRNGEPGVVYLDNINCVNPTLQELGPIRSVNACSEVPLYPFGSCILASLVLPNVVENLGDWTMLGETARLAVRFLDRVIDRNYFPLNEIAQVSRQTRDIGVGVMGWETLLDREGILFTSNTALQLASDIGHVISVETNKESQLLALKSGEYLKGKKRRNRTTTAIAPTGHISRIAGVSQSIYPTYATQLQMTAEQHVKLVAAWQLHVDNGISYTICFKDKSRGFVDKVYRLAYERLLKSMSVYQDGSRANQPCTLGDCGL